MITSKQIITVSEDYLKSGMSGGKQISIYSDPSSSDFTELIKTAKESNRTLERIRFVADSKTKHVAVADAYDSTHEGMHRILGMPRDIDYSYSKYPYILDGEAPFSGGRPHSPVWDKFVVWILDRKTYDADFKIWLDGIFSYNWSWLDRYIPGGSSMMNQYKRIYLDLLKSHPTEWSK